MRSPEYLTGVQPILASKVECKESVLDFQERQPRMILKELSMISPAAKRCAEADFDGVELHGALWHLLSQFLSKLLISVI